MYSSTRLVLAVLLASVPAAPPALAVSDCCFDDSMGPAPGCDVSVCEDAVCAIDSYCCDTDWDSFCVAAAIDLCSTCGPLLDDFLCYKVKRNKEDEKFEKRTQGAEDQFQDILYRVKKPAALCNPAEVNSGFTAFPEEHLKSYKVKPEGGQEKFQKLLDVRLTDRLGVVYVDVIKPDRMLLPTAKDLSAPVGPLSSPATEKFVCYKVRATKGRPKFQKGKMVQILDQFGLADYEVKKPTRLCAPAGFAVPVANPGDHLMCYKVKQIDPGKGTKKVEKIQRIYVNNAFGPEILDTKKVEELCLEAEKELPPPG